MRTFTIIWLGQLVSTIGSFMTVFALTLWVWQQTESATTLALISFFAQVPRMVITLFAGVIVDRFQRKFLMLLGDSSAALCTAAIGLLHFTGQLQVWHLYCAVAVHGCLGQIQQLAYTASIALLVPKQHYTRAGGMGAAVTFSSAILAPALAGGLYPAIGLGGIIAVDMLTFTAGLGTLLAVQIPQPDSNHSNPAELDSIWQRLTFGFRYIGKHPSLIAMVIAFSLFAFSSDMERVLYSPLILARTEGSAQILGAVTAAGGVGGVLGAILMSVWGGFPRRIHGMLLGFTGAGCFRLLFGLGQTPFIWIPTQFLATLHTPIFFSSSNAIWYAKVPPNLQGRVLAADQFVGIVVSLTATLTAGLLADRVFEPMMQSNGMLASRFGMIVGTQPGSGIALLFILTALWMLLVGIAGYGVPVLREVENLLPDHDGISATE